MALNVFGNPITDETLKAMPEYANKETITREDRAQVALKLKRPPSAYPVKVFGYIYNASGQPLTFACSHDWSGHVEGSYPQVIENGQYGFFLHIGEPSTAAVVYNVKSGLIGDFYNWVLAWHAGSVKGHNKVLTVFQEPQTVIQKWEAIREKLSHSGQVQTVTAHGLKATVSITDGNTPTFDATITLDLPFENA